MKSIYIYIIFSLSSLFALADTAEDNMQLRWRDRALADIESLKDFSDREAALKVGAYAGIASSISDAKNLPLHRFDVYIHACEKLQSLSGHAQFFKEEIENLYEENSRGNVIGYDRERWDLFRTLSQLKTPEVVIVLIGFLDDKRDEKSFRGPGVYVDVHGNDYYAASSLMKLIKDIPLEKDRWGHSRKDISAIKEWSLEIMEGERIYQFKGALGTYNIHGRIPDERKEMGVPISLSPSMDSEKSNEDGSTSSGARWAVLVAFLLLGAAIVKLWLGRGRAEV